MRFQKSWTDFKALVSNKGLGMQYENQTEQYYIWAVEDGTIYYCRILITIPAGSDQEDFEDNYKDNANKPINLGEDRIMNSVEIRDTNAHTSSISDSRGYVPKTLIIDNALNQAVTIQVQGSRETDFTPVMNIGNSFEVNAETSDYATLSDYFPYLRVVATCSVAPTSGEINVYVERVKA